MAILAEMTQLSPTMSEGTIVNWLKKEGDSISPGDIIAEVETDKAVMEMEAYDSGTILSILANNGDKVSVGLPIAILGDSGEDITDLKKEAEAKLKSASSQKSPTKGKSKDSGKEDSKPETKDNSSSDKNQNKKSQSKDNQKDEPLPASTKEKSPSSSNTDGSTKTKTPPQANTGRILASPLAKSIAIQKSVDLKYVRGTGPGGRILQRDVYDFIDAGGKSQSSPNSIAFSSTREDRELSISGMRKTIAERLTSSKINLPHFYLNMEIDANSIVSFRKKINDSLQNFPKIQDENGETIEHGKISINDIIVRGVALSLERHPNVNASWKEDTIIEYGRIDLGIAVSIDDGLITPVLRNANQLGLLETSQQISNMAGRAKKRKLKPEEFTGSTFTISNLGMFGIDFFTAIINEPEAAILAVGAIEDKPVVRNGEVVAGRTLQLTLSCDHRVVDGAEGAKFLGTLKRFLENPETLAL